MDAPTSAADLRLIRSDTTRTVRGAPLDPQAGERVAVATATAVAVITALLLSLGAVAGAVPVAAALPIGLLLPAAVTDVRARRLPDPWTLAATVALLAGCAAVAATTGRGIPLASIALGALVFAGPLLVIHLVSPRAMGFGDVKVALVLGAAAGVVDWRLALVALTLAAGLAGTCGIACRARTVPFGPFLVVATAITLLTDHVWMAGLVEGSAR